MRKNWEKIVYPVNTTILGISRVTFGKPALAIVLIAVLQNLIFLPLKIIGSRQIKINAKKLEELVPAIKTIDEKYRLEPRQKQAQDQVIQKGNEIKRLYQESGISFNSGCLASTLPLLSGLLVNTAVISIKDDERFSDGGMLWFKDLTRPDRYFVLPAVQMVLLILKQKLIPLDIYYLKESSPTWARRMETWVAWAPLAAFLLALVSRKRAHSGLALYYITSSSVELAGDYFIKKLITDRN
jgi:membrane protein insertase Oxa1/YidC/SpoIIIJ